MTTTRCLSWLHITLIITLMIILGEVGILYYQHYQRPVKLFFAKNTENPIYPLNQPNIAPKTLLTWATLAATDSYTLDFVNFEDKLQAIRKYYTAEGYQAFRQALVASGNINGLRDKKLIINAVPIASPVIRREAVFENTYIWEIQLKMLLTTYSASQQQQRPVVASMLITRVPTHLDAKGIGIAQFVINNATA